MGTVKYKKNKTWQNKKCKPHTEPRLVICTVEFHQRKNISDGVGNAYNGSKKNHEDTVPFEFRHYFELSDSAADCTKQKRTCCLIGSCLSWLGKL